MRPKLILLDADGVLWRGGEVIPQAPGFIRAAQAAGIRCVLITNNAGLNRASYEAKCHRLGLALSEADIYSSAYLAGPYIAQRHAGQRVLVLGSGQLVEGMAEHQSAAGSGATIVDAHGWLAERGLDKRLFAPEQLTVLADDRFDAVLMGIDINANYAALSLAAVACARGAVLIAANDDATFPFEGGMTLPGNGSFVALVARVAAVEPVRLGKPEQHLLHLIVAESGIAPGEMLMIGDRIETDIDFARRGGVPGCLVLTGVVTPDAAPPPDDGMAVAADLDEVAEQLRL